MRVAYILCSTLENGGASKAFLNIINGAIPAGVAPVAILPDEGPLTQKLMNMGVKTYVIPFKPSTYPDFASISQKVMFLPRLLGRLYLNFKATNQLKRILGKEQIDIVHTNTGINNIGRFAAQSLGIPHVFHIREYGNLDFGFHHFPTERYFRRHLLDNSNYNIFITQGVMRHYIQGDHPQSKVIYDGVLNAREDFDRETKRTYFLYAGRIEPKKGLAQLLEAYSNVCRLHQDELPTLKIAGEGDETYTSQMKRFVSTNHLDERIEFLGNVQNISEVMSHSLCTIIPSVSEGFGFVMPEAMFNGSIVIGHNTAGTKEQFDNGLHTAGQEIGFRYNTTQELEEQLLGVATMDRDKRLVLCQRAFDVVNKMYTCEQHVAQIMELYNNIMNDSTRDRR